MGSQRFEVTGSLGNALLGLSHGECRRSDSMDGLFRSPIDPSTFPWYGLLGFGSHAPGNLPESDVRMIQPRSGFGFAPEPLQSQALLG